MNKIVKTIVVLLVILVATGITGAAVYELEKTSVVQSAISTGGPSGGPTNMGATGAITGTNGISSTMQSRPTMPAGGGDHAGGGAFNTQSLLSIAKNLGMFAAMTVVIVLAEKLISRFTKRKKVARVSAGS